MQGMPGSTAPVDNKVDGAAQDGVARAGAEHPLAELYRLVVVLPPSSLDADHKADVAI
jgi:hypothetical protein